jgi:hypothetical protein
MFHKHIEKHVILYSRHAVDKIVRSTLKLERTDNFYREDKFVSMLNYDSTGGVEIQLQEFLISELGRCE